METGETSHEEKSTKFMALLSCTDFLAKIRAGRRPSGWFIKFIAPDVMIQAYVNMRVWHRFRPNKEDRRTKDLKDTVPPVARPVEEDSMKKRRSRSFAGAGSDQAGDDSRLMA